MTHRRPRRRDHRGSRRVLAIHRYYWPDSPPYASILRAIVARWARDGARVRIIGSQPSYKPQAGIPRRPCRETLDGTVVERVRLLPETGSRLRKLVNMPLFVAAATRKTLSVQRGDVVMCSTSPPVVLAAAVSLAARVKGARFIYHCMDIHPEIGALSGEFANPVVYRLLRGIDRATCRRSAAIVVLSEDMRDALLDRDPDLDGRIVVLNNFALPEYSHDSASDDAPIGPPKSAHRRIVFTGNVGRYQGLEDVVTAVLESNADVELVIMGEGQAKADLRQRVDAHPSEKGRRVIFSPYGTPAQARALMQTADVGLVSLVPGIVRYAYPSKTMTYLSEGLPLLLVAEGDTEIARTVRHEGIGLTAAPGDRAGIEKAITTISEDGARLGAMRESARQAAEAWFDTETLLERWADLLHRVRNGSTTRA